MAGTIKGIILEIGGDTSGLQKALRSVNTATSSLTKELRGINSLLKLDPSNTELLSQKQKVLAENIEQTSNKLEELRKVQEMANQDISKISPENYRNLQREIINTENKLKQLQLQASKWTQAGDNLEAFGTKVSNISSKIDNLGNTLTTSLTLPVLAIGTAAVTVGNDFEAQMSRVQAITGATKEELELLTNQAIDLGAETSFSATAAAAGMEDLASAGFTTNEIMEAMPGLLDLAASSGAELATASEIAASAIRGFGLEASQSSHVADVFAEASARTNAQVEDMGEAMKYVAPVAKTVGLSIEETAAAIGIMSDAGIKGSQAGTTLRSGLVRIVKPTKVVKEAMEQLDVEFYNSDGTMKSLAQIIDTLQKSTAGLTDEVKNQALAQIFGTEALSGMLSLVNRGSKELSDITKSFEDCDGAAEEMANVMLDNAKGALESLSGSLESAGIAIQKALAPEIKDLAKWIQDLVDDFNDLSDEEKQSIINKALLVAAIGPAVKILGTLGKTLGTVTKGVGTFSKAIAVAKTGATSANQTVNSLANGITFLTNPVGLATVAVGALAAALIYLNAKQSEENQKVKEFAEDMKKYRETYEEYNKSIDKTTNANLAQIDSVKRLKDELFTLVDENGKVKAGYESRVDFILNELNGALDTEYKLNGNIIQSYKDLQNEIDGTIEKKKAEIILKSKEEKYTNAINTETEAVDKLKEAREKLGMTYEDAKKKVEDYFKAVEEGTISADEALSQNKDIENLKKYITAYEDAEKVVKQCVEDRKSYENDYALFVEGKYNEIGQTITNTTKNWINASIKEIQSGMIAEQQSLNKYKELYETTGSEVALQQKEQAEQNLRTLADELIARTTTIEQLGPQEILAWKTLANNSYDVYKENISKMSPEMQAEIQRITGILISNTSVQTEAGALADRVVSSMDRKKQAISTGQNIVKGLQEGIQDKYLNTELMKSSATLADNMIKKMNLSAGVQSPSKYARKTGRYVDEGLILGIKDKEKEVLNTASKLSNNLIDQINKNKMLNFSKLEGLNSKLNTKIINSTKTIYTTPQITFNVQELDEARLQQCFNYINKKFGSQY